MQEDGQVDLFKTSTRLMVQMKLGKSIPGLSCLTQNKDSHFQGTPKLDNLI